MKFLELGLINWGPYLGEQNLSFETSSEAPVVLIHGENMRGKTSIMRALRWALYGNPGMTHETKIPDVREFANWDARDSGEAFEFGAFLRFEHGDRQYEIVRLVKAKQDANAPHAIAITKEPPLMREIGGETIAIEQIDRRIQAILHPNVADFFLFDGELLDTFEEALRSDEANSFIRDQIEMTLGVPALLNLRLDLGHLLAASREQARKFVKAESENKKFKVELDEADDAIEGFKADLAKFDELLAELKIDIEDLEGNLLQISDIRDLVVSRQGYEVQLSKSEFDRVGTLEEIKGSMEFAWWLPLANRLPALIDRFEDERSLGTRILSETAILKDQIWSLEKQLQVDQCDRCGQNLPDSAYVSLRSQLNDLQKKLLDIGNPPDVLELERKVQMLRPYAGAAAVVDQIVTKERNVRTLDLRIKQLKDDIKSLTDRIGNPEFDAISLEKGLQDSKLRQARLRDAQGVIRKKRDTAVTNQKNLLNKLAASTPAAHKARAEIEVYERLLEYVRQSIDLFRTRMREQVQETASGIFGQLINESDYASLRISGNYYLKIVDGNDRVIEKRSAGASEIVTISLIGALGECSVEQAPIVMDTPFGRLDNAHRANILEWLASRKSQSILFVQSGEFVRERDLVHLKNRVGREYKLRRLEASSTRIEEI